MAEQQKMQPLSFLPQCNTRVLLGDDHRLIGEAMQSVLAQDCEVIGTASDGRELIAQAERLQPDAVLLDISMPLLNGLEAAWQIPQRVPNVKLVFATQTADRSYVQAAFEIGASGYLLK